MACEFSLNKAVDGRKEGSEGGRKGKEREGWSDREVKTRKGTGKGGRRKENNEGWKEGIGGGREGGGTQKCVVSLIPAT